VAEPPQKEDSLSLLDKIISAEHTAASWFEKVLVKVHAVTPTFVAIADRSLPYVSTLLKIVVAASAGAPAAAAIGSIVDEVQRDLDVANAVVYDTGATPTVGSFITSIQNNIAGLLTAGHVTDASSVATLNKAMSTLGALVAAIPTPTNPTTPPPTA
jgi:hypothetical protein